MVAMFWADDGKRPNGAYDEDRRSRRFLLNVGVKEVTDQVWLVSFMDYDLGFFDHETCRLETAGNPFAAKVLPQRVTN
jgi:hypothetical protein